MFVSLEVYKFLSFSEAVLNLSPKAHTKTDTSSQEKLFGEIQNSFSIHLFIKFSYRPMHSRIIRRLVNRHSYRFLAPSE